MKLWEWTVTQEVIAPVCPRAVGFSVLSRAVVPRLFVKCRWSAAVFVLMLAGGLSDADHRLL